MKFSKNDLTLDNIGKLIDRKLIPVFGELDGIKQQIIDGDNSLKTEIKALRRETKDGFDTLFEAVTNSNDDVDKDIRPRLKRLENKVFAQ